MCVARRRQPAQCSVVRFAPQVVSPRAQLAFRATRVPFPVPTMCVAPPVGRRAFQIPQPSARASRLVPRRRARRVTRVRQSIATTTLYFRCTAPISLTLSLSLSHLPGLRTQPQSDTSSRSRSINRFFVFSGAAD
jgi:hypothetical protein